MKKSVAKFVIFSIFMGTVSGSVAGARNFCGFRSLGECSDTRAGSSSACININDSVVEAQVDAKLCKEKTAKVEEDTRKLEERVSKLESELKDHKEKDYHGYGFRRGGWWKHFFGYLQNLINGIVFGVPGYVLLFYLAKRCPYGVCWQ